MLPENLRADVLEIAEIAKACPTNLQERCFEVILAHYLDHAKAKSGAKTPTSPLEESGKSRIDESSKPHNEDSSAVKVDGQDDISVKDIHVKAKKFIEKYGNTIQDINQIFYLENGTFLPLYEELKSTKNAECQIRIGLLQALASGLKSGEFQFNGEDVRKECQDRKCYDISNFSANFKNSSSLFDGFEKYDKSLPVIKLSEAGRKVLASLITELK